MTLRKLCDAAVLATSDGCEITCCRDCGHVRLTLPHFSIRLPVNLFLDAAECIQEAAARLPEVLSLTEEDPTLVTSAAPRH